MARKLGLMFAGALALSACVPLDAPPVAPDLSNEVRDQLRVDLLNLVLSFSLVAAGIVAMALSRFHWATQGVELLSFGAFSLLYGVRMLAWTPSSRLFFELAPVTWDYIDVIITYFLPVAVLFFLEPFLGNGRLRAIRWLWRLQFGYAIVATVIDIVTGEPSTAMGPYRILVMIWFAVALYLLFRRHDQPTKRLKVVRAGLVVFVVFASHATLSGVVSLPGNTSVEPLGLFVFFLSLGYVVVDDFFSSRNELVAINRELETARTIQRAVLPASLPQTDRFEVAARYHPVSAVAGDFYDFHEDEQGLSLLLADVSGHGIPAALIASMVKVAYSAQHERVARPSDVLSEVNRILCGKIRGQFVTGGCLFFPENGSAVSYSSAGHPPLVVIRSDTAFECKLDSVLMGFFTAAEYEETQIDLVAGDKLVLYTDGLVEAMNARGEFFGVERLLAFFREHADESAEAIASGVVDHVRSWSGLAFADDVTLVVVRRA